MQELILLYHDEADECFQGALLIFFSNRDLWRKARMGRNYFKQFGTTSLQRLRKKPSSSWKGHLRVRRSLYFPGYQWEEVLNKLCWRLLLLSANSNSPIWLSGQSPLRKRNTWGSSTNEMHGTISKDNHRQSANLKEGKSRELARGTSQTSY